MRGLVCTKDLVRNCRTIIAAFGLRAFLRCLVVAVVSRGNATFLNTMWGSRRRRSRPR